MRACVFAGRSLTTVPIPHLQRLVPRRRRASLNMQQIGGSCAGLGLAGWHTRANTHTEREKGMASDSMCALLRPDPDISERTLPGVDAIFCSA